MDIAANGGAPFSLQQILTTTFNVMYRIGLYNEKCLTWDDKPDAQKTWPNWKYFFTKVVRDHCRLCKTSGMNYQTNSVIQENMQQDMIKTLSNLASATVDNRNVVANLTAANSTLAS
eukprot:2436968-Ditylum_brightwellii.AAC.1